MFSDFLKNISILKKFLFINLIVFILIGILTAIYLQGIQPNLINKKTTNHIKVIDNTIDHIKRLKIKFNEKDIRKFLFSTRFLFQNLDRVIIFDNKFNVIGDSDTLDLDPRSFSQRIDVVEMNLLDKDKIIKENNLDKKNKEKFKSLSETIVDYSKSSDFGKPYTYTQDNYNQFLLVTIKNVNEIVKALTKDSITTFPALNWIIGIPVANGKCFSTDKAKSFKFFGIELIFRAPVESRILFWSTATLFIDVGSEPVAMTI